MSDEERRRIIDEALHGAKVDPAPAQPKAAECCDHCMLKMGTPPAFTQPAGQPWSPNPSYGNLLQGLNAGANGMQGFFNQMYSASVQQYATHNFIQTR